MASNIVLSSEDIIVCPKCFAKFPIEEGITRHTIDQHANEYTQLIKNLTNKLTEKLAKEASDEAEKNFTPKIKELTTKLENNESTIQDYETRITKIKKNAESQIQKELDEGLRIFQDEIKEKNSTIKELKNNELSLLKEKEKLDEDKKDFELLQKRELEKAKKEIALKAVQQEAEKFELKEAEYKKQIDDAVKANRELTRKLQQGSQQLQGEILEQTIEKILREAFPNDDIREVKKGTRGADVIQGVCNSSGNLCGTIIWETKRTQRWSDKWLEKVKEDCRLENADIPVIVSTVLPNNCKDMGMNINGVWVCSDRVIRPIAEVLRELLIQTSIQKLQTEGSSRKADLIYSYLGSSQFNQILRSVFETFVDMETDLNKEKKAMVKAWKAREVQLNRVALNMSNMVGQISGIARDSLPELDTISYLQLPGGPEAK